eukprot:5083306-Amphidinium_carterae.1
MEDTQFPVAKLRSSKLALKDASDTRAGTKDLLHYGFAAREIKWFAVKATNLQKPQCSTSR